MASPFPGMDPYLEGQVWADFHTNCISEIQAVLVPQVRPRYVVRVEEHVYLEYVTDDAQPRVFRPDVVVAEAKASSDHAESVRGSVVTQPTEVLLPMEEELRHRHLEIRMRSTDELVTVIELLSPANKRLSSHGREDYLKKRDAVLRSPVHLVEIDLLRGGERLPMAGPLPTGDFYVIVSRAPRRPRGDARAIGLRQPLPTVAVPLGAGDDDALLDLRQVVTAVYDRAGYDYSVDYSSEPVPVLGNDDAAWARGMVSATR